MVQTIEALSEIDFSFSKMVKVARQFHRRNAGPLRQHKRLNPAQIAEIQKCIGTVRQIAKVVGCSKSAAHYWRQKSYDVWEALDDSPEDENAIQFEAATKPQRCPEHGLINVWPCVRCAAESARAHR